MLRDNDLMRQILIDLEKKDDGLLLVGRVLNSSKEDRKFEHHVTLLADAGFLLPVSSSGYRMTNGGHDYPQTIRDDGIWRRTKDAVAETGGNATLEILKSIATGFLKNQIKDRTGIEI